MPCAFLNRSCTLALGAGAVIDEEILRREIERLALDSTRLIVDRQATIMRREHATAEQALIARIGSTGKGVGVASAEKVLRSARTVLANDVGWLAEYLDEVSDRANEVVDAGGTVFLEGAQGFGLSLHHGHFPYVTSRDTTAGALCSEAGMSPTLVSEIVMVVRTFPIRVAGHSGPLPNEIDWDTVSRESGAPGLVVERTTVTGNVRRVARFDLAIVRRACTVNRPTQIALMFADYIDWRNRSVTSLAELSKSTHDFIDRIEDACGVPVTLIGTGPRSSDMFDLRPVGRRASARQVKGDVRNAP